MSSLFSPVMSGWVDVSPLLILDVVVTTSSDFDFDLLNFFWVLVRVIGEATGVESGRVDAPGGVAEEVPGGKPLPKRLEK